MQVPDKKSDMTLLIFVNEVQRITTSLKLYVFLKEVKVKFFSSIHYILSQMN